MLKKFAFIFLVITLVASSCRSSGPKNQFKPKVRPSDQVRKDLQDTASKQRKLGAKQMKKNKRQIRKN